MPTSRPMTLDEWVQELDTTHPVHEELARLHARVQELEVERDTAVARMESALDWTVEMQIAVQERIKEREEARAVVKAVQARERCPFCKAWRVEKTISDRPRIGKIQPHAPQCPMKYFEDAKQVLTGG